MILIKGIIFSNGSNLTPVTYFIKLNDFQSQIHGVLRSHNVQNNNLTYEQMQALLNQIACGNINMDDVLQQEKEMKKKEILEQHKYAIKYNEKDNRYHTYVPDITKSNSRKSIAKRKLEDLENYLVDFYTNQKENTRKTFKEVFQIVQENKLLLIKTEEKRISAKNTQLKNQSDYKRYFSNTDFESKYIDTITKKDIENICLMNLQRYDMRKKAFASLRGILKSAFDLAFSEYWIMDNVFLRVNFKQYENMYVPEVPIKDRVHSDAEVAAFIEELHKKQLIRPKYSSVWALELQIIIGLRRGEIPALTWDQVSDNGIFISQEQLTTSDNQFIIVEHTKTSKDRLFPLTDDLKDFLTRLKAMHNKYYPDSKYLFPNRENTAPITNRAVYLVYQGICQKLGIKSEKGIIKGPHSFRRNVSTSLVNSEGGNLLIASALLGHSPTVAEKNYLTGIDLNQAQAVANQRHLLN